MYSEKGYKVPIPKYYRDLIYDKAEKDKQLGIIKKAVDEKQNEREEKIRSFGKNPEEYRLHGINKRKEILKKSKDRLVD